jgi:hypothetical protein
MTVHIIDTLEFIEVNEQNHADSVPVAPLSPQRALQSGAPFSPTTVRHSLNLCVWPTSACMKTSSAGEILSGDRADGIAIFCATFRPSALGMVHRDRSHHCRAVLARTDSSVVLHY